MSIKKTILPLLLTLFLLFITYAYTPASALEINSFLSHQSQKNPGFLVKNNSRQLQLTSDELVNTYMTNTQEEPDIAMLRGGGLIVVYESYAQDGPGHQWDIRGQLYLPNGTTNGNEFFIPDNFSEFQYSPQVATLLDGSFVVAWHGWNHAKNNHDVMFRIFEQDGTPRTGDIPANSMIPDQDEKLPALAALQGGGFVIGYQHQNGLYARIFDVLGNNMTTDFRINTVSLSETNSLSLAALNDGGFVAVWTGSTTRIKSQRFDALGNKIGDELQVYVSENVQNKPRVRTLNSNEYVVVWQEGSTPDIYAQRLLYNGTAKGPRIFVNDDYSAEAQSSPAVAPLSGGGFAVVWQSNGQDGNNYGIYGRTYDSSGHKSSDIFRVNLHTAGSQQNPAIAPFGSGFAVVWDGPHPIRNTGPDIWLRRYNSATQEKCMDYRDCPADYKYCLPSNGICAQCSTTADCKDPRRPICVANGCDRCQDDSDCTHILNKPYCNKTIGACTACLSQSNCTNPNKPFCDFDRLICTDCQSLDGSCSTECTSHADCSVGPNPYCFNGECVECLLDGHCTAPAICDNYNQCSVPPTPSAEDPVVPVTINTNSTTPDIPSEVKTAFAVMGGVVGGSTAAAAVPVIATNPALLWGLVQFLQGMYYFLFFNVQYPDNLKAFLEICNIGTFSFAPNFFEDIDIVLPSPPHFWVNGYSGFFLEVAGPTLTIWAGALGIGVFVTILSYVLIGNARSKITMLKKLVYNQLVSLWQSTFIDLLYAALLQMQALDMIHYNAILSVILAALTILFVFIYTVVLFNIISRKKATNPPLKKWTEFTEYMQRLLSPFCMIFLYYYPFQQVAFLWTLNGMQIMFLFWGGFRHHKLAIFNQMCYFFMHLMVSYLVYDDLTKEKKDLIGWIVIGLCITTLSVDLICMLVEGVKKVHKWVIRVMAKNGGTNDEEFVKEMGDRNLKRSRRLNRLQTGLKKAVRKDIQKVRKAQEKKIIKDEELAKNIEGDNVPIAYKKKVFLIQQDLFDDDSAQTIKE